jgi:hypothetical protein
MAGSLITDAQKNHYFSLRAQGWGFTKASREAGFSVRTAKRLEGITYEEKDAALGPIPFSDWEDVDLEAMYDLTGQKFCQRYFGMTLSPWQMKFWQELEEAWISEGREFQVVNVGPGLGKSTVLVGFGAKVTVWNRDLRGLFISRASTLAIRNTMRLRRALERTSPFTDAETTLAQSFGLFRPKGRGEVWNRQEFIVEQMDGSPIEEKEPTWSAFGFDSDWLGNRLDLGFGDDLDSTRHLKNMEIVETNRTIFDNELEPRIDPPQLIRADGVKVGGLMCIAQQRLSPMDFSAHALSKVVEPSEDDYEEGEQVPEKLPKYTRVIYKVHYDEKCEGRKSHRKDSPSWPDGCLLDPRRMSWMDIQQVRRGGDGERTFQVVYQQQDMTSQDALVQQIWVDGGRDANGQIFIGCWDDDRDLWELPKDREGHRTLGGDTIGVITCDPSVSNYWAVEGWVYHPGSEQRFLLDIHRARMEAPDFLEWSWSQNCFTGVLEDWYQNFTRAGAKLDYVIVEQNAAHRYMLQYDFFHRWMRLRGVQLIGHSTQRNKLDPDYGVQMLGPVWRDGKVRLPGKRSGSGEARYHAGRLVGEVIRYPNSTTTDCVMAQWFLEANLTKIFAPGGLETQTQWRPSWVSAAPV